jgi:integrase
MHTLLAQVKQEEEPSTTGVLPTFRKIADLFLDNSKRENKPNTFRMHCIFLESFVDRIKAKRVNDLKVHHVSEWIAASGCGQSSACTARGTVFACLNWAVEQGYIRIHPLTKLKRGSHKRRERVLTADELKKIREFTNPYFADFLLRLELTGARPFSELAKVTAAMVDWKDETISLGEHKNEKKGKTRTI